MRIKICGITGVEDALLAEDAGIWAIGFIFMKDTPRHITPETARGIAEKISEKTEKIGVFVNHSIDEVKEISGFAGITKIQLHGEETPEFCLKTADVTGKEVIKAFRIKKENDLGSVESYKNSVSYILLDTFSENQYGGTGRTFDWEIAKKAHKYNLPLILAGGLNPGNIRAADNMVKPFALDISSGVEKSKGIKDPEKIRRIKIVP